MLPENSIVVARRVELLHAEEPHPFHLANRERAAENWTREIRARPALFDGAVLLASAADIEDGVLKARCHLVPYSTLMLWRRMRPVDGALDVFAMAVPVGSDGGVLAGRMARHTANAGLVYCPCGSFDRQDIAHGRFDADANMARELAEETGIDLGEAEAAPGYGVLAMAGLVVILRVHRFAAPAAELAGRAQRHIGAQTEPELAAALSLMEADATVPDLASHMAPILAWHFANR